MDNLQKFLDERFPEGIQMFNTRNITGDSMVTIYHDEDDDITVDYCEDWEYIEIFGLTEAGFKAINAYMNGVN